MKSDTPRTDAVIYTPLTGEKYTPLKWNMLVKRARQLEHKLAAEKKAREEAERYSAEQGKVIESRNAELDAEKKAREEAEKAAGIRESSLRESVRRQVEAAEARVREIRAETLEEIAEYCTLKAKP